MNSILQKTFCPRAGLARLYEEDALIVIHAGLVSFLPARQKYYIHPRLTHREQRNIYLINPEQLYISNTVPNVPIITFHPDIN